MSQSGIKNCVRKAFKLLKKKRGSGPVGIIFLSDREIGRLNRKYLKHNGPTDILAFDYSAGGFELAISLDTARRNAKTYNTSLKEEVTLYIIHGILHLYGYNDGTLGAQKRMLKKQEELLRIIACGR